MAQQLTLQHRFLHTVTFYGFDSTVRTIKFGSKDGGDKTVEVTKIRPGGMDGAVVQGGLDDRSDLTAEKAYDLSVDPDNEVWLDENTGCPVSDHVQPLGPNKIPVGSGRTKTGILSAVRGPTIDPDSSNKAVLGITLGLDTDAA